MSMVDIKNRIIRATDTSATAGFYLGTGLSVMLIVWWLMSLSDSVDCGEPINENLYLMAQYVANVTGITFLCGIYKGIAYVTYPYWQTGKRYYNRIHEVLVVVVYLFIFDEFVYSELVQLFWRGIRYCCEFYISLGV
jgi:hypothetical protein